MQAVFFRRDDSDCYWTSDCASAWDWCDLRAFAINRSWRDFTINWSCVTGETSLSTGTGNQCNLVVPSARERSPKLRRQAWLLLAYQLSGADDLRSLLLELVDGNPRVTNAITQHVAETQLNSSCHARFHLRNSPFLLSLFLCIILALFQRAALDVTKRLKCTRSQLHCHLLTATFSAAGLGCCHFYCVLICHWRSIAVF